MPKKVNDLPLRSTPATNSAGFSFGVKRPLVVLCGCGAKIDNEQQFHEDYRTRNLPMKDRKTCGLHRGSLIGQPVPLHASV